MLPTFCLDLPLDELRGEILSRAAVLSSVQGNNRGGWRSATDLFTWCTSGSLRDEIARVMPPHRALVGWAVVHRAGTYHDWHVHGPPRSKAWSGILYVDPGGHGSGRTLFDLGDPDPHAVTPQTGRVVLFPSRVRHSTEPHSGEGLRITVAFDTRP